jgi:plastocyanin
MSLLPGRHVSLQRGRRFAVALLGAWVLLYIVSGAGVASAAGGKAATHTVVIEGVKYTPDALTIKRGDTVVWVNKDPFPHTVTAKGTFDSHEIAAGKSWKLVAHKAGEYAYTCTLHPNMMGTLKVE